MKVGGHKKMQPKYIVKVNARNLIKNQHCQKRQNVDNKQILSYSWNLEHDVNIIFSFELIMLQKYEKSPLIGYKTDDLLIFLSFIIIFPIFFFD